LASSLKSYAEHFWLTFTLTENVHTCMDFEVAKIEQMDRV